MDRTLLFLGGFFLFPCSGLFTVFAERQVCSCVHKQGRMSSCRIYLWCCSPFSLHTARGRIFAEENAKNWQHCFAAKRLANLYIFLFLDLILHSFVLSSFVLSAWSFVALHELRTNWYSRIIGKWNVGPSAWNSFPGALQNCPECSFPFHHEFFRANRSWKLMIEATCDKAKKEKVKVKCMGNVFWAGKVSKCSQFRKISFLSAIVWWTRIRFRANPKGKAVLIAFPSLGQLICFAEFLHPIRSANSSDKTIAFSAGTFWRSTMWCFLAHRANRRVLEDFIFDQFQAGFLVCDFVTLWQEGPGSFFSLAIEAWNKSSALFAQLRTLKEKRLCGPGRLYIWVLKTVSDRCGCVFTDNLGNQVLDILGVGRTLLWRCLWRFSHRSVVTSSFPFISGEQ